MLLSEIKNKHRVRIVGFSKGKGIQQKLRQLGIIPGDEAEVLRIAPLDGPILLQIGGREIALGKGIASKVFVEEMQ